MVAIQTYISVSAKSNLKIHHFYQLHFFILQTKPTSSLLCNFIHSIKQISGFVAEIIWAYTEDNIKFYEIKYSNYFLRSDSHSRLLKLTLHCDPEAWIIHPVDQILLFCFTLWLTWTNLMSLCILHDQAHVCHNWLSRLTQHQRSTLMKSDNPDAP